MELEPISVLCQEEEEEDLNLKTRRTFEKKLYGYQFDEAHTMLRQT